LEVLPFSDVHDRKLDHVDVSPMVRASVTVVEEEKYYESAELVLSRDSMTSLVISVSVEVILVFEKVGRGNLLVLLVVLQETYAGLLTGFDFVFVCVRSLRVLLLDQIVRSLFLGLRFCRVLVPYAGLHNDFALCCRLPPFCELEIVGLLP